MNRENVWDYPRPPRLEAVPERIRVVKNGIVIADSLRAMRVLETTHPPVYYVPQADIAMEHVKRAAGSSFCEWKGNAEYWDVLDAKRSAWSYPSPTPDFAPLRDHLAFYAAAMDACFVDDEKVLPQPGGFYGGWITSNLVGPFKGEPGSMGW